ncbi:MAG TPA: hypothetical protein PLQ03_10750 [Brevundimonas sp.]|nr:hypothetical protein [uncultured Brevundimonas sp.]HRO33878.1 hypothetical protein [Brevundimonas sp.]
MSLKRTGFGPRKPPAEGGPRSASASKTPPSPFEAERKAAQRAAVNALKRAKRAAEKAGVQLSEWEGEFLDSVSERVKTHGRAFADPEKGAPGQALSAMQGRKLKEITKKAKGAASKRSSAIKNDDI